MPNYFATVALAAQSADTADVNVNTFAIAADAFLQNEKAGDWQNAIARFYNTIRDNNMCLGRSQLGHVTKMMSIDGAPPNYPIFDYSWGFTNTPANIDLPLEVNLCVSYANDTNNAVARARRRGRIYLAGVAETSNNLGRPVTALVEMLGDAYLTYVEEVNDITGITAGVWSRKNAAVYDVERVWVDNEWDTMRSRGGKATERYTVSV